MAIKQTLTCVCLCVCVCVCVCVCICVCVCTSVGSLQVGTYQRRRCCCLLFTGTAGSSGGLHTQKHTQKHAHTHTPQTIQTHTHTPQTRQTERSTQTHSVSLIHFFDTHTSTPLHLSDSSTCLHLTNKPSDHFIRIYKHLESTNSD